jgi:hypothetical protein
MVITTLSGYLVIQGPATTAKPAAPVTQQGPATTGRATQPTDTRELRDQIREQVRAAVAASAEGAAQGPDVQVHVPPPLPADPRVFTIQGPNGERTTIGMPPAGEIIPPQAVDISIAFFLMLAAIIIGLPIARAFARRMDRKSGGPAQIPREVTEQLTQINQAVDAIALEVERISEGQRFTTRLLSEQRDAARQTLPSSVQR